MQNVVSMRKETILNKKMILEKKMCVVFWKSLVYFATDLVLVYIDNAEKICKKLICL